MWPELLGDRGGNTEESLESFKLAEEAGADYVSVTLMARIIYVCHYP